MISVHFGPGTDFWPSRTKCEKVLFFFFFFCASRALIKILTLQLFIYLVNVCRCSTFLSPHHTHSRALPAAKTDLGRCCSLGPQPIIVHYQIKSLTFPFERRSSLIIQPQLPRWRRHDGKLTVHDCKQQYICAGRADEVAIKFR